MVTIVLTIPEAIFLSCILDWRIEDYERRDIGTPGNFEDSKRIREIIKKALQK